MSSGGGPCTQSPLPSEKPAALAVLSLAQFTATLEFSIVFVALPSIDRDLQISAAFAPWVSSAYAVTLASWLIVAGRLADRFGAARVFALAMLLFALTSGLAAMAPSAAALLIARGGQGLAAALLQPAALGLLQASFSEPGQRSKALGVWSACGALGLALGALVGGLLTVVSWRLTFAINVPLTLACALGGIVWLRSTGQIRHDQRIPLLAAVLATGAVLGLTTGLTFAAETGWSSSATIVGLASGALLGTALLAHERRARRVLIDRELRRLAPLRLGALAAALYMASMGSTYYLLTLLFQLVASRSALETGVAFLPLTLSVTLAGPLAHRAMQRLPQAHVLAGGFVLGATGLLGLSLTAAAPLAIMVPALIVTGLGNGLVFTAMFAIGTQSTPARSRSSAGALLTSTQYLASALALACLVLLVLGPEPTLRSSAHALAVTAALAATGAAVALTLGRTLRARHDAPRLGTDDAAPGDTARPTSGPSRPPGATST